VGEHDYVSATRFARAAIVPGILVLRPEEPLFFANADPLMGQVRQRVLAQGGTRLVVLSLEESPDLDSSALEALGELSVWLSARAAELRLARLKERSREALLRAALAHLPEAALDYSSVDDAVRGQCVRPEGR
jgi:MFS superfamily sulfate permease-like transporter